MDLLGIFLEFQLNVLECVVRGMCAYSRHGRVDVQLTRFIG